MSSDPPSSGTLDDGWGSVDEPSSQPSEASAALRAPRLPSVSLPEEQGPLRDTLPPPVPVALYVQTMMNQADEDEDAAPASSGATHTLSLLATRSCAPRPVLACSKLPAVAYHATRIASRC